MVSVFINNRGDIFGLLIHCDWSKTIFSKNVNAFLQVSGEVYAVDKFTLLIKDFIYDGNGRDTYFMVGVSNQPGRKGDIVPNEFGKTNVLQRYLNEEFTLTMPNGKIILISVKICLNFSEF